MKLHVVEISLPLRAPLVTALGTVTDRRTILVGVDDGTSIGWGEAAPFPGTDDETRGDVWSALVDGGERPPTAEAALSTAMADLSARRAGTTLADHLGAHGDPPTPSLAVGAGDVGQTLDEVERAVAAGCGAVKLKVAPGDGTRVAAVVGRFPGISVGTDANGSLGGVDDALALEQAGAAYVEQPFDPGDLHLHAALRDLTTVMEVILDESLRSADDAGRIFDAGAADRVCLKPGRLGIPTTLDIARDAARRGVGIKIGGMFESAVGRAVAATLARLPGSRFDDVAPDGAYFTGDVGTADPAAPGIGFDPRLDGLTVRRSLGSVPPGRGTVLA